MEKIKSILVIVGRKFIMKLAFISDIHGNATALDAVLQDIKNKNVDKVYVLGDICYQRTRAAAFT